MPALLDRPPVTDASELTAEEGERLIAALTRRKLLGGSLALGLLTACGASAPPTATVPTTRMINTAKGSVQVPANPQRVVCIDNYSPSDLLDVGYTPVGVPDLPVSVVLPEYASVWPTIAKIGTATQPDLEKIAALKPDLILGTSPGADANYERLSAIAPTALFSFTGSGDWIRLVEEFPGAIGHTNQLLDLQRRYEARATAIRTDYATLLGQIRWGMANGASGQWWHYLPDSSHGKVLGNAGAQFVAAVTGKTGNFLTVSYEQISQLADATVIVVQSDNNGQFNANTQALLAQPAWQTLPAAQAGHVFPLARFFPTSYKQAIALLDEMEAILKKLQGGN